MKKPDKLLIGIVSSVILLVVIAFAVALLRPKATYQSEDSPDGVAFNYLFALQQRDYERAYGYLLPSIRGYPRTSEAFVDDIRNYSWSFNELESASTTLEVESANLNGKRAEVKMKETRFYEGGLFDSRQYTNFFTITLRQGEDGAWKIEEADSYWLWCWNEFGGCK